MKPWLPLFCVLGLLTVAVGQQPLAPSPQVPPVTPPASNLVVRTPAPTYSDLNCAGYISGQIISNSVYVTGGWNSPHATRFSDRDYVYLNNEGLQEGSLYSIVRELRDPNQQELFKGQHTLITSLGNPYAELGRVKIIGHGNRSSIAQVEFSCDTIVPGDVAIPYAEHPQVTFRRWVPFDRFAPPNGKTLGRIAMAKDFDYLIGTGKKVYLNVGADQGIKPGDYFRVVRSSTDVYHDPVDYLSAKADVADDTQKHPPAYHDTGSGPRIHTSDFPRHSLAELIVLNVNSKSATGMITFALENAQVGDTVELEEPPPPLPPPAVLRGPQISCMAQPATVQLGDPSTITCNASSPDNRPIAVEISSERGRILGEGSVVTLDTHGAGAGVIGVLGIVTDDRNMTGNATTEVTVVAPQAVLSASKIAEMMFALNSSRVDNKAKAILDDVALRLQRDADAKALIIGFGDIATAEGQRLATARANNVMLYLTREKGIDPQRISTRTANGGDTAEVWLVPAGARMPPMRQ